MVHRLKESKKSVGFHSVRHSVTHPDSDEPEQVGWDGDGPVLDRLKGITSLKIYGQFQSDGSLFFIQTLEIRIHLPRFKAWGTTTVSSILFRNV